MPGKRKKALFILIASSTLALWWFWPEQTELSKKTTRPTSIDTVGLSGDSLLSPPEPARKKDGGEPGGMMFSSQPVEPREKWAASLSVLTINAQSQKPVAGVKVHLHGPISLPPAWSDMDGNVSYRRLPGGNYFYSISHAKYALKDRYGRKRIELVGNTHQELLLELAPSCVARGRVIDARKSAPLDGVRVFPGRYEEHEPFVTASDGKFELHTGEYKLSDIFFQKEGYAPREIYKGCRNAELALGDVVLTREWILSGIVIDEKDEPIPGVAVQDYPESETSAPPANLVRSLTDAGGRFELNGLPTTDEIIFFYKDGYAPQTATVNPATRAGFEVRMLPACTLNGIVKNREGKPIEAVTVSSFGRATHIGAGNSSVTDESGRFSISGLSPGDIKLFVNYLSGDGQIGKMIPARCADNGEAQEIVLGIDLEARSDGIVVDEDGTPLAMAEVTSLPNPESGGKAMPRSFRSTRTDHTGRFDIPVPAKGRYSIFAFSRENRQSGHKRNLEGPQTGLKIKLKPYGLFDAVAGEGIVVDESGEAVLSYSYCWARCNTKRLADKDGKWRRENSMPPDSPPLWVFLDDGRIGKYNALASEKNTDGLAVAKVGPGASILGRLGDSIPAGLTRVELKAWAILVEKVADQEFSFPLVPPGMYELKLTAPDGRILKMEAINIQDGKDLDLGDIDFADDG